MKTIYDWFSVTACANSSMGFLEDEIDRVKEENRMQHEQILALQSQLADNEDKLARVCVSYAHFLSLYNPDWSSLLTLFFFFIR